MLIRSVVCSLALSVSLIAQPSSSSLPLGPLDEVSIQALGAPEIDGQTYRIDERGTLRLPLAGEIAASAMTPRELESRIEEGLRRYVRDPKVLITRVRYAPRPVSILGAVRNPGVIQVSKPTGLLEALSTVGGLQPDAGPTAILTRDEAWEAPPTWKRDPSGRYVASIELEPLLNGETPDVLLMPDDVVVAAFAEQVYVVGAVQRPGVFKASDNGRLSVLRALSLAGGLARHAAAARASILTQTRGAPWDGEPVDLKSMIAGRTPDRELLPDEILFVPTSGGKAAAAQIGRAALNFGTGAAIWSAAR